MVKQEREDRIESLESYTPGKGEKYKSGRANDNRSINRRTNG